MKYRNVRTSVDGIKFHSKKEAARYLELKLLEKAKKVRDLRLQPRFPLRVNGTLVCTYVADFMYYDEHGRMVVEDAKGFRTQAYVIKKKLLLATSGIAVEEV